jgi:hypothetical protein
MIYYATDYYATDYYATDYYATDYYATTVRLVYYILSWSKVTNPGKILYWVPYIDVDVYLHSNSFIGAYPYL